MFPNSNKPPPANSLIDLFQAWLDKKNNKENEPEVINIDSPDSNNYSYKQEKKGQTLTFENVRIDFPLRPYAAQVQMMKNIIHTLNDSENALLESPTGSGKSLALLCAALAWRENEERKVAGQLNKKKTFDEVKLEGTSITIDDSQPIVQNNPPIIPTPVKREIEEDNKPENWKKKFKCNSKEAILIDEDSFEDFQKPVSGVKKNIPSSYVDEVDSSTQTKANLEQVNSVKYQTFQKVPRIFVGSRTHKQITQLVSELKTKTRYNPRTTILGSREHLCIHPKVSKSYNKTEDCVNLLDKSECNYAKRTHAILTHPTMRTTNRVWDIEDMVSLGKKTKGCPYYASRKLYEGAEVIFCPYNYIIDPIIRKILDINLKNSIIILDEAHNIEDSSRSAGSFEVEETTLYIIKKELDQIIRNGHEKEAHQSIEVVVDYLYDWITSSDNVYNVKEYESHYCHWTGNNLINKLKDASITALTFHDVLKPAYGKAASHAELIRKETEDRGLGEAAELDDMSSQVQIHRRKCLSNNSLTVLQGIFMVLGFLFQEGKNYADDYQMVLTKRIERSSSSSRPQVGNNKRRKKNNGVVTEASWSFKLGFKCLNPGIIFRDMTETTRSVILTSGTLSPLNTFASELETKFEGRLEANHVIDKSQVWVGAVPRGPNRVALKGVYTNWESFQYQDDIGEALAQIVETVPYGVLCFLPSYNALDKLIQRWKITKIYDRLAAKKMLVSEPKGSDKMEFEGAIGKFYKQVDDVQFGPDDEGRDGALFFAVFRGKVSEGIDFTDNYCRAVVTVGIPYPGVKDMEVKFKKEYNDKKRNQSHNVLTGSEWYSAQAFRAINQALGRCIRHKNDWGAIILLEDRFQIKQNVQGLSKWVRNQFQNHPEFPSAISSLKGFVDRQLERTAAAAAAAASQDHLLVSESTTPKSFSPPPTTPPPQEVAPVIAAPAIVPPVISPPVFTSPLVHSPKVEHAQPNLQRNSSPLSGSSHSTHPTTYQPSVKAESSYSTSYHPPVKEEPFHSTRPPTYHPPVKAELSNSTRLDIYHPPVIENSSHSNYANTYHPPVNSIPTTSLPQTYNPPMVTAPPIQQVYTPPVVLAPPIPQLHHPPPAVPTMPIQQVYTPPAVPAIPVQHIQPQLSTVVPDIPVNHFPATNLETDCIPTDDDDFLMPPVPVQPAVSEKNSRFFKPQAKIIKKPIRPKIPTLPKSVPQATKTFKPPAPITGQLHRSDLISTGHDDSSNVRISCSSCGRFLLEGSIQNLNPAVITHFSLISQNIDIEHDNIVEVCEPRLWEDADNLIGGPININNWPNETNVTLNAEDGVCYRLLNCICGMSKSQGVVIREVLGRSKNTYYKGRVFLWLTQLRVLKTPQSKMNYYEGYRPEDKIEIPSSQVASMNDMFYDL